MADLKTISLCVVLDLSIFREYNPISRTPGLDLATMPSHDLHLIRPSPPFMTRTTKLFFVEGLDTMEVAFGIE